MSETTENTNEHTTQDQRPIKAFNPQDHLMQIRSGQTSKDYLPVQWRIAWFRSAFPDGVIETEMIHLDMDRDTEEEAFAWNAERRRSEKVIKQAKGFCVFRATVKDGRGGIATGTKSEKAASFGDFIEKAETGAIGRALAALGYGTQFVGDEWDEAHRIVDSGVDRQAPAESGSTATSNNTLTSVRPAGNNRQVSNGEAPANITEQQLASIRKLHAHLNKAVPDDIATLTFGGARKMLQQLTAEYNEAKNSKSNKAS